MIKNSFIYILLISASYYSYSAPIAIISSSVNSEKIRRYEKFEFTFTLNHEFNNPFDPEEADVQAVFQTPDGNKLNIPAFYYQNYTQELQNSSGHYALSGAPVWKIRFTPIITGSYAFDLYLDNIKLNDTSFQFSCVRGEEKGFVRIDKKNNIFCFDNGEKFYPIGHNIRSLNSEHNTGESLCNENEGNLLIDNVIQKMSFSGENFILLDFISCGYDLVYSIAADNTAKAGIRLDLKNAWVLDKITDKIFERDMFISFFFATSRQYSVYSDAWPESEWEKNPFNIKNGGFLENPNDFFSNSGAKKAFKKYLRYIIARYGYSPRIFSWLMFSDMDFTQPYRDKMGYGWSDPLFHLNDLTEWQKEMAGYVRSIDPYRHLISTSFAYLMHGDDIWNLRETDFLLHTTYGSVYGYNMCDIVEKHEEIYALYDKPYLIAVNGANTELSPEKLEAQLHTGLWAQYMNPKSPGCIGFNHWRLIESNNLYFHYKALAEFNLNEEAIISSLFVPVKASLNTSKRLAVLGRMNKDRHYLWIYDINTKQTVRKQELFKNIYITYPPVKEGKFIIEFWNTFTGQIISKTNISTENDGSLIIKLPDFKSDIACKIVRI